MEGAELIFSEACANICLGIARRKDYLVRSSEKTFPAVSLEEFALSHEHCADIEETARQNMLAYANAVRKDLELYWSVVFLAQKIQSGKECPFRVAEDLENKDIEHARLLCILVTEYELCDAEMQCVRTAVLELCRHIDAERETFVSRETIAQHEENYSLVSKLVEGVPVALTTGEDVAHGRAQSFCVLPEPSQKAVHARRTGYNVLLVLRESGEVSIKMRECVSSPGERPGQYVLCILQRGKEIASLAASAREIDTKTEGFYINTVQNGIYVLQYLVAEDKI